MVEVGNSRPVVERRHPIDLNVTCPVCKKGESVVVGAPCFPFCSDACRDRDLEKWIEGGYRIASTEVPAEPTESPEAIDR